MTKGIKPGTKFTMGGSEWVVGEPVPEEENQAILDIFEPVMKITKDCKTGEEAFLTLYGDHPEMIKNMIPGSLELKENGYSYTFRMSFGNTDSHASVGKQEDEK